MPIKPVVPSEGFTDEPFWLLQLTLSGLLDQLQIRRSGTYERLNRGQVATMLGWDEPRLSKLFYQVATGKDGEFVPPRGLEPGDSSSSPLRDTLLHIKAHLHVFGAQNYPYAAPEDPRRIMLTELWARLFEEPQRAQLSVPPGWFRDIALMLLPDVERPVSPLMVVAAGQALLANLELQDTDAIMLRRGAAPPITKPASQIERETLVENLAEGQGLVRSTIEALISVSQLPPALHGAEAMLILGRLRLPLALAMIEQHIRRDGAGFRLWRALSMYLKAERYVIRRLPPERRESYLFNGAALPTFDRLFLGLLRDPPDVDAYPARSLSIETIEQRLKLMAYQIELGLLDEEGMNTSVIEGEVTAARLAPGLVRNVCLDELARRIDDPTRPARERAYATLILNRRGGYERVKRLAAARDTEGGLCPIDGLLHHALSEIAGGEERDELPNRPPLSQDQRIRSTQQEIAEWVRDAVARHALVRPVPQALLREHDDPGTDAYTLVAGSALESAIFTLITDYDGVWRRRVADALRTGMLSGVVAPILARLLAPGGPVLHGTQVRVLPWMRELAVLGISFQSSYADDEVVDALIGVAHPANDPALADDDERAGEVHAALWALADLILYIGAKAAKPSAGDTARLARVRRTFVDLAERKPQGSIQRALAYGLVCVERITVDGEKDDEVSALIADLRLDATDPTVLALVGQDDLDPSRPPVARALGRVFVGE